MKQKLEEYHETYALPLLSLSLSPPRSPLSPSLSASFSFHRVVALAQHRPETPELRYLPLYISLHSSSPVGMNQHNIAAWFLTSTLQF